MNAHTKAWTNGHRQTSIGTNTQDSTNTHVYKREYTYFLVWCDFLLVINQINNDIELNEWIHVTSALVWTTTPGVVASYDIKAKIILYIHPYVMSG